MGRRQRDKGNREERAIVHAVNAIPGWSAKRVPLSGAADGFKGDVVITAPDGKEYRVESKVRAKGFKRIREWLIDNDLLWVRADHTEGLWVVPARVMVELLRKYGKN